ncbi:O-succinylhomoserine sulfhydrylase [Fulvitalea axinellae]|uniref:O-succinylhomoserine sulfhydrylase n=1 Tax=Fulvitalea axinellae TaxID=1182444 RepID=A0AAU9CMC4_9BACT|nr:O-succinylhomoserine sulfhydrylase [Fulvitalea axinellae]
MNFETIAIREQSERSANSEHSVPVYLTSGFTFDDAEHARAVFAEEEQAFSYSRYNNPNTDELVDKIKRLENVDDALTTSSGMSAIFGALAPLLNAGDHAVVCRSVFGSTYQLFSNIFGRWNIGHTYVPADDCSCWEDAITPQTKILFVETPTNPALDLIDLKWAADLAKRHNLILLVDNTFSTPYLQRPADFGADIVLHSTTKYLDGQGRTLGGVIGGRQDLIDKIRPFVRQTGPCLSPFNAWVISKSLETLAIRLDRHCANALELAKRLEAHPAVERVKYPFLKSHPQYELARKQMRAGGGIVSIFVKGGLTEGKQFLDGLNMCSLSANLGDSRSIVTHPASTTHSKLSEEERLSVGISQNLVRISAGLEHVDDIWNDLKTSLDQLVGQTVLEG